jgi:hypothetical protein
VKSPVALPVLMLLPALVLAQPTWHSAPAKAHRQVAVARSVVAADFPTAEVLAPGDFHFEVAHRFFPPVNNGYGDNFGLDGPATMRLALSYGVSERLMVTAGRSNLLDNLDVQARWRVGQATVHGIPAAVAVNGGVALNTDVSRVRDRLAAANVQGYGQAVANAMLLQGRLGLGLVPSVVYNSTVFSVRRQHTISLGGYAEYFLNRTWGAWVEYNAALSGYQGSIEYGTKARSHDTLALGWSIETGGHVFYLFATNNTRISPAQYLVGAADDASPGNWRLAFGLTRYL